VGDGEGVPFVVNDEAGGRRMLALIHDRVGEERVHYWFKSVSDHSTDFLDG